MLEERKELFSEKLSAGKRYYFFDVRESAKGEKYLVISESEQTDGASYKHRRIMVFQEHLLPFKEVFNKAVEFIQQESKPKAYEVKQIRREHSQAYEKWTEDEDIRLKEACVQGKTIEELAEMFQRKIGAIRSRLKKLELLK